MKKIILVLYLIIIGMSFNNLNAYTNAEIIGTIYLTFDDGPSANTELILNILKKYNVKATFFVIKREDKEDIYRRIIREGHSIGGHSCTHRYDRIYLSSEVFYEDINNLNKFILKTTGRNFDIIRFPGGSNNTISIRYGNEGIMQEITDRAADYGYIYYDWNVDSYDSVYSDSELIADEVIKQCLRYKNSIVLMHDSPDKIFTPHSLNLIIPKLLNHGYKFKRIDKDTPVIHFN